ncbi:MAG TPA: hypothetical protein VNW71_15105 [Thermoanaerobaculia bacterium]|nr:hypothetical protein [Thermoanaerobaculia bacterium]
MAQHSAEHKAAHDALYDSLQEYHTEMNKIQQAELDLRLKRAVLLTVANQELGQKLSASKSGMTVSNDMIARAVAMCW